VRMFALTFLLRGGRNMVMLTNGQWVDDHGAVPAIRKRWIYDAATHTVRDSADPSGRLHRWQWLSLTEDQKDYTDFFTGLRTSTGLRPAAALDLMACQTGNVPSGRLRAILRDGSEVVLTETGDPVVTESEMLARVDSVNHIR
jgi:hypothetical protein